MGQPISSRMIRAFVLAALGGVIVWQIVTRSLTAHLAYDAPRAALRLQPNQPRALVALADRTLNPHNAKPATGGTNSAMQQVLHDRRESAQNDDDHIVGWAKVALKVAAAKRPFRFREDGVPAPRPLTPQMQAAARAQAEAALLCDPLNARALRILAQLAAASGDTAHATRLMQAAADRSLAESVALFWLMQKSFEAHDDVKTIVYADAFLRKRPQFMPHALPFLASMAEGNEERSTQALKKALIANPPWRGSFFANLPRYTRDARTSLNLLLGLKQTQTPPTTRELGSYLNSLLSGKRYELAYYTWLQFLPAAELGTIGYVNNAGFETSPSGLPFDWAIRQGTGATIDIATLPGEAEGHGLLIELGPGRADFQGVTQVLLLAPGSYRLEGKLKGESRGKRGLRWTMRCAATHKSIAEGPMFVGVEPKWADFEFGFTVPDSGCRAQQLRLQLAARSASEQLVNGSVWYDDLHISREQEASAAR
jgi:hypothetical protein